MIEVATRSLRRHPAWSVLRAARRFGFGPAGVFLSITIAFSTFAVLSMLLFRRGRWKRSRV